MPKAKRSVEEIKQDLKKEIIRLGIQDNPSRTEETPTVNLRIP